MDGFGTEESKRREAYSETFKKFLEFHFFIEKHRIYLPKRICDSLSEFAGSLRKSANAINIFVRIEAPFNDELGKQRAKVMMEAVEALENSIPDARLALEQEFRHILGVEQDAKSD